MENTLTETKQLKIQDEIIQKLKDYISTDSGKCDLMLYDNISRTNEHIIDLDGFALQFHFSYNHSDSISYGGSDDRGQREIINDGSYSSVDIYDVSAWDEECNDIDLNLKQQAAIIGMLSIALTDTL